MTSDAILQAIVQAAREAGAAAAREAEAEFRRLLRREVAGLQRTQASQLRTLRQFVDECPAFRSSNGHDPTARLRKLIERQEPGLRKAGAVRRLNGRVYINRERFDKWLERGG